MLEGITSAVCLDPLAWMDVSLAGEDSIHQQNEPVSGFGRMSEAQHAVYCSPHMTPAKWRLVSQVRLDIVISKGVSVSSSPLQYQEIEAIQRHHLWKLHVT